MNKNKEAMVMLWANQIQNKRKELQDVPARLREDVYYVLVRAGFYPEAGKR